MTDDPEPLPVSERRDDTGSRPAAGSARAGGLPPHDPPTVRSGARPAPGAAGSSSRRVELVEGTPVALPVALPLPQPGERIDHFELVEPIGVGGMGAVFLALDTRLDRHVALKILPPEQAYDPEVVQRFYQEGRAAARLDHENIARVYTIGNDARFHFIAFEYIEGTTVRQRVERNGPLPVSEAINYTLQIADALVHAAERGVVHRDIKPSNIIVTPHGRAKLVDMGLARRFERGRDDGLTQSGMTLGTFDYISPEQARDPRDVDVRSDLYSLGCTLFHVLTGRPPFPEGTVLQKLIQHQEEAPPDVRALNPQVPPGLASILVKLMAKDRDRRYQTPEQLVRDLLTVAGALGLRSVSPEGLVWLSSDAPPTWERHLVWGIPALAFAAVVSCLVWWGQDPSTGLLTGPTQNRPGAVRKSDRVEAPGRDAPAPAAAQADPGQGQAVAVEPEPDAPRDIAVDSTEDLLGAVASARPRSVIMLTDDGPYDLGVGRVGRAWPDRFEGRDLTIRAAAGVHPVIRLARDLPRGGKPLPALLDFSGGRVTLDGLEFLLEPGDRAEPMAAVRVEDTELTVLRCVFRRTGAAPGPSPDPAPPRFAAVQVRSGADPRRGDRPSALTLDRCHFDAGQVGVRAGGPADVLLRDCTLAATEPVVWLDNGRGGAPVAADLRLRHVSILAGENPVFRFDRADARVWLDDSVVGAVGEGEATLIATDRPDSLAWRGRGNLYARVGVYLLPTDAPPGREAVRDPLRWRETPDGVRETGSVFEPQSVWEDSDPMQDLAEGLANPARAFRLLAGHPGLADVGARREPFGPATAPPTLVASNTNARTTPETITRPQPRPTPAPPVSTPGPAPAPAPPPARSDERPQAPTSPATPAGPPSQTPSPPADATPVPEMPPMRVNDLPEMIVMPPGAGAGADKEKEKVAETVTPEVAAPTPAPAPTRPDHTVLRTRDQLLNVLAEPGAQGRLVRIASDADWELSSTTVRATGSWRIQAEPGRTRPRLRFLPAQGDPKGATARTAMIDLRSGSLQLEGLDVVLPRGNAPREGRWAAFSVWPTTDLSLTGCTVTVEGDQVASAVVSVEAGDAGAEKGGNAAESSASTVRVHDTLIRAGGDFVDVAAGRRLVLEMDNAVAATGGGLVHAHGTPRGQPADRLSLTLRQVTARMAGGLVHLDSTPGEPELPVADVNARYTVLATVPKDAPLIRVDGQDPLETMRDRIVWEGQGVGYHQITSYRRDQSRQVGAVPTNYNRSDWTVAAGSREQLPVHGDLKFRRNWPADRPAWTLDREDVRLETDSRARASGSDLDRIPEPPADPPA